jgi:hypothetical protein
MSAKKKKEYQLAVVHGAKGRSIYLNEQHIAGPQRVPSSSGADIWMVSIEDICDALNKNDAVKLLKIANWDFPAYRRGYVAGVMAAAALAAEYPTTHPYRLDDCIECKLNVTSRKKPRRRLTTKKASPTKVKTKRGKS